MKKIALLSFAFVLSLVAAAQEKYVEVVVSDTLLVEPQEWVLHLSIEKKYDYSTMIDSVAVAIDTVVSAPPSTGRSGPLELEGTSIAQLSALVKKFSGKVLTEDATVSYNLSVNRNSYETGDKKEVTASFGSRRSLEGFLKEAEKLGDVESQITGTLNPKIQDFQIALEKKLMTAAKQKAARLADLGGGKLGSVILISEVADTEGGWLKNFIDTIIKMDFNRKSFAMYMNPDKIKLEKSLKVRFALL